MRFLTKDQLRYALPLGAHREDLYRNMSSLSGDFDASVLINEELSGAMSFYYEKARGIDDLACGRPLYRRVD